MNSAFTESNNIPIVYYHSVGPINHGWTKNYLTLELKYFEDQIEFIKQNFNVISLSEYFNNSLNSSKNGKKLVISFDDGFLDNWIWAYPILKKNNLKATIFISTDFIDQRDILRPNLDDYWNGKVEYKELFKWGYLSWAEIKEMEKSGIIDFQSHTITHTKLIVSDKLVGFHNANSKSFYTIANLFPHKKAYYIEDPNFNSLIPLGYPLFEESSSIIARQRTINPVFINDCCELLKNYNFNNYDFKEAFKIVEKTYNHFKDQNNLVLSIESEESYLNRIKFEITESKRIIEEQLSKKVNFICWPHGDCCELAHQIAIESGYLASTIGSKQVNVNDYKTRIPQRISISPSKNNRFLSKLKIRYVLGKKIKKMPYFQIGILYNLLRYGKIK